GPYMRVDGRGYQLLMDYHGGLQPFRLNSIQSVMDDDELAPLVRDRAVILGVTPESVPDSLDTPFSTGFSGRDPLWGVAIHAHITDQLIREALDGAPSLSGLPRSLEHLWIWVWAMAGAALGLAVRSTLPAVVGAGAGVLAIGGIAYFA